MFFPWDFIDGDSSASSLAQVATLVDLYRDSAKVILLDNGDILQGQPVVYHANFIDTTGKHLVARMMNELQYDAATIGNHDIEAGPQVYRRLMKDSEFPWLGANVTDVSSGQPYFRPYRVVKRAGVKIAILGLTTPNVPEWLPAHLWEGMKFEDVASSARYWMEVIQESEKPDLVIGLFHSGTGEGSGEENAVMQVAREAGGFDLIFFGHDHRPHVSHLINLSGDTVYLLNPGSHARYLSVASLHIRGRSKKNIAVQIRLDDVTRARAGDEFLSAFHPDFDKVSEYVQQELGILDEGCHSTDDLFGPGRFTGLVHRIQMDISGADISFAAPLSFNTGLEAGPVAVADLFALYRYENYLYTMELTGREIKNYLEYSCAGWFSTMTSPDDYLLSYRLDENGLPRLSGRNQTPWLMNPSYNFDSAEGIIYTVDVSRKPGERVNISSLADGRIFHADSTYLVAINSYRGSGGGGHLEKGAGIDRTDLPARVVFSTGHDLRYLMMDWFRVNSPVRPVKPDNWQLLPVSWVTRAVSREKALFTGQ